MGRSDSRELHDADADNVLELLLLGVRRLCSPGESGRRQRRGVGSPNSLRGEACGKPGVLVTELSCKKPLLPPGGKVTNGLLPVTVALGPKMIGLTSKTFERLVAAASP